MFFCLSMSWWSPFIQIRVLNRSSWLRLLSEASVFSYRPVESDGRVTTFIAPADKTCHAFVFIAKWRYWGRQKFPAKTSRDMWENKMHNAGISSLPHKYKKDHTRDLWTSYPWPALVWLWAGGNTESSHWILRQQPHLDKKRNNNNKEKH